MIIASYMRDDKGNIYLDDGSGYTRLIKPRLSVPRPHQLLAHAFVTGIKHGLMVAGAVSFLWLAYTTADDACNAAMASKEPGPLAVMFCEKQ